MEGAEVTAGAAAVTKGAEVMAAVTATVVATEVPAAAIEEAGPIWADRT